MNKSCLSRPSHTHTHEKKRKNRITHVYNGTPASFLNQNTMCRVSSPGGVMSHGNSAGFPSTTLILTSGTANENRRIVRLKGLRFSLPVGRPEFRFPSDRIESARGPNGDRAAFPRRRNQGNRGGRISGRYSSIAKIRIFGCRHNRTDGG